MQRYRCTLHTDITLTQVAYLSNTHFQDLS